MSQQERDFSNDGFVGGMTLPSKASARLSPRMSPGISPKVPPKVPHEVAQGVSQGISTKSNERTKSQGLFVPPHDLNTEQTNEANSFKKLDSGRVAIADIDSSEFEPGWGSETKPHSQRELFLSEQAFAEGKKAGELEAREVALEEGRLEGREAGYREGFAAGSKEHGGEVERRALKIADEHNDQRVDKIAHFLGQLMEVEKGAAKRRDTELMTLMIAVFEKTLPSLADANGEQEVEFFLNSILKRFEDIPQISITLSKHSQDLVSRLRGQVENLLSSDKSIDTMVSFRFDENFGASDCRIAWAEGEVERRFEELWDEVKYALERHLPKKQKTMEPANASSNASPDDFAQPVNSAEEPHRQAEQTSSEQNTSKDVIEEMVSNEASPTATVGQDR